MPTFPKSGVHFTDPSEFYPYQSITAALYSYSSTTASTDDTAQFFTNMAATYGIQDTTNWTAGTYKTLLNVSSGKGLVSAIVGPSVAATDVTTFEITVDGVLTEIAGVSSASTDRFSLLAGMGDTGSFTVSDSMYETRAATWKDSSKTVFKYYAVESAIMPWSAIATLGTPCLRFERSLLIRAKNSASITNSTATAYSAVAYKVGL